MGYLNQGELTGELFVRLGGLGLAGDAERLDCIPTLERGNEGEGRFYRTGDLARCNADGTLEFVGRSDTQVKVRGFRVELGEIEAQIRLNPEVEEAVVLALDYGHNDKRLVAYVQMRSPHYTGLKSFLKSRLPGHMQPATVVTIAQWPLTHNGKIDRKALPVPQFAEDEREYVAPRSDLEVALAAIWSEVLGVGKVGVESNFFDLGGHSLLATQVVSRIRQQLQIEVPLRALFEQPTLGSLAEQIQHNQSAPVRPPIVVSERIDKQPLSFAQQRLWLLQQLNPESGFFNMPLALRLDGQLNFAALHASFAEIVRRHEVLRTTFPLIEGQPVQKIAEALPLSIVRLDLQGLDPAHHSLVTRMMAEDEAALPFELATDCLEKIVQRAHAALHNTERCSRSA